MNRFRNSFCFRMSFPRIRGQFSKTVFEPAKKIRRKIRTQTRTEVKKNDDKKQ